MIQFRMFAVLKAYRRRLGFQVMLPLAVIALPFLPALTRVIARSSTSRRSSPAKGAIQSLARLSESLSVRAAGRGQPSINLSDGRAVLTAYAGPEESQEALRQDQAHALSLASADFDEDGVPDLISGYSFDGPGIVTLLRGNVDSIYPNSPDAQQRKGSGAFTDTPFLSPARVFALPIAADFLGAGDFDADGHWDAVVGSRTTRVLYLRLLRKICG